MINEILTSPLFLLLKGVLPDGFENQVLNFIGAWFLIRFTVAKHFTVIEGKFDNLTGAVENGFKAGDERMTRIEDRVGKLELSQGGKK